MADDERKVFLITGASTGIGAATARMAVEAGYRVVLSARSADKLEALAGELGGDDVALAVPADVAEWEDNERLAQAAIDRFGGIDVVFANAGFGAKRGFLEESVEHWRSMVLTNVYGVALTIRATLPHLLERGSGHYLITSSVAGRRVLPGSLYSASKWAVTAIGEALRQELRQMHENRAIRVTLIEPGMVDTPFFDNRPGPDHALLDDDIARAVMYALSQPERVDVNELLIRPTSQAG
jgi:NADP-dependent 3-hydroxy acid dehydrogenase YdfG